MATTTNTQTPGKLDRQAASSQGEQQRTSNLSRKRVCGMPAELNVTHAFGKHPAALGEEVRQPACAASHACLVMPCIPSNVEKARVVATTRMPYRCPACRPVPQTASKRSKSKSKLEVVLMAEFRELLLQERADHPELQSARTIRAHELTLLLAEQDPGEQREAYERLHSRR